MVGTRNLLLFFCCLASDVFTARILVYNLLFAQSLVNYMDSIVTVLEEAGHNVTVIVPRINSLIRFDPKRFRDVRLVDLPGDDIAKAIQPLDDASLWTIDGDSIHHMFQEGWTWGQAFYHITAAVMNQSNFIDSLRDENFDLGITEYFDAIFYQLGIDNYVLTGSTILYDYLADNLGLPLETAAVPSWYSGVSDQEIANSLVERAKNWLLTTASKYAIKNLIDGSQRALDEAIPGFPRLTEMAANASLVLVNIDPLIDFARPTLSKILNIGGIGVTQPKSITEEWRTILSERPRNVLISFGSIAMSKDMPLSMKRAIVELAHRFPDVTFVWKYEVEDDIGRGVENLVKTKWTPQGDLLRSGLVTVFVTHGGMASTLEAAHAGVPCLVIPIFVDQMRNAAMLAARGGARKFSKYSLSNLDLLGKELQILLEDSSYKKNARRLADLLAARPFQPRQLVQQHVAFIAEHGPFPQLRPAATLLSAFQRQHLDILTLLALASIVLLWTIRKVLLALTNSVSHKFLKID